MGNFVRRRDVTSCLADSYLIPSISHRVLAQENIVGHSPAKRPPFLLRPYLARIRRYPPLSDAEHQSDIYHEQYCCARSEWDRTNLWTNEKKKKSQQGLSDCLFSIQSNSDTNHELALIDQLAIYASGMKSRPVCISLFLSLSRKR